MFKWLHFYFYSINNCLHLLHLFTYKCLFHLFHTSRWGVAAMLLKGGRTMDNCFKLLLNLTEISTSKIRIQSQCKLIPWEDSPKAPFLALQCTDWLPSDTMNAECPFRKKVIALGRDFRQVFLLFFTDDTYL